MKALKIILQVLLYAVFILVPIALGVWVLVLSCPWWVALLSSAGALLIESLLLSLLVTVTGKIVGRVGN